VITTTILIYAVSFKFQLPVRVTIHNQCSNIKFVSPVYFCNDAVYLKLSNRQIDISTKMNASFEISTIQDEFEGDLLYKLQRYVESDDQHNMDTSATEINNNKTKCIQML
jgi:hypothetical protein